MNEKINRIVEIEKSLENLLDLDMKQMTEREIIEFRSKVGKTVNEFYTLTNVEIRRRKRNKQ
jgi:hypothetical protein